MIEIPGKIPIRIHPLFWVMILLLGFLNSFTFDGTLIWAVVIFFSVLVHEYGHALTALFFGQQAEINLVVFGGLTVREGKRLDFWKDFLIVLNGPLFGFILCGASFLLLQKMPDNLKTTAFGYAATVAVFVNLFWTFINLLPIQPLDGGKLLEIALEGFFGVTGLKIALFLSCIVSLGLALLCFALQNVILGIILFFFFFEGARLFRDALVLKATDRDLELLQLKKEADTYVQEGHISQARECYEKIVQKTGQGVLFLESLLELTKLLVALGEKEKAYTRLQPYQKKLSVDGLLFLYNLAFNIKEWKEVTNLAHRTYQVDPTAIRALQNAMAYAELKFVEESVGWLECAIREGLPNAKEHLNNPHFDPIRNTDAFFSLSKRV